MASGAAAAANLVYTVPAGRTLLLRTLVICNTSGAAITTTVSVNYAGVITTTALWRLVPLAISGSWEMPVESLALDPGDKLYVGTSATNAAVIFGSGSLLLGAPV